MSTPAAEHPIDPLSHALGRIEGRLEALDTRLTERFAGVEARFASADKRIDSLERYMLWGFGITWTLVIATGILSRLAHG
jgi:hypothetical protein